MTENPLGFLDDFSDNIDTVSARVNQFTEILPVSTTTSIRLEDNQTSSLDTLNILNDACDRDMSFLPYAAQDLKVQIDRLKTNIHKLSDTVSCDQISPLLRRVSHGAICIESPFSLTVLWSTSFGLVVCCFILLTVRAALFNSVREKKRRPTKPRRIVEKEFDEYKVFMSQYFDQDEIDEWNIDGNGMPIATTTTTKPDRLEFIFDQDLELKGTFDTSASTSNDERSNKIAGCNDEGSERGGIHHDVDEYESSYGSSYDSELSDDDDDVRHLEDDSIRSSHTIDDEEQSVSIASFMSDVTKSSAALVDYSLRSARTLLSSISGSTAAISDIHEQKPKLQFQQRILSPPHHGIPDKENNDIDDDKNTFSYIPKHVIGTSNIGHIRDIGAQDDVGENDVDDDGALIFNASISDDSLYTNNLDDSSTSSDYPRNHPAESPKLRKGCHRRDISHDSLATAVYSSYITYENDKDDNDDKDEERFFNTPSKGSHATDISSGSSSRAGSRIIEALTPSSVISALSSPRGTPQKAFSFLARTKAKLLHRERTINDDDVDGVFFDEDTSTDEEMDLLVQPKQLSTLTPFKSSRKIRERTVANDIIIPSTKRSINFDQLHKKFQVNSRKTDIHVDYNLEDNSFSMKNDLSWRKQQEPNSMTLKSVTAQSERILQHNSSQIHSIDVSSSINRLSHRQSTSSRINDVTAKVKKNAFVAPSFKSEGCDIEKKKKHYEQIKLNQNISSWSSTTSVNQYISNKSANDVTGKYSSSTLSASHNFDDDSNDDTYFKMRANNVYCSRPNDNHQIPAKSYHWNSKKKVIPPQQGSYPLRNSDNRYRPKESFVQRDCTVKSSTERRDPIESTRQSLEPSGNYSKGRK